MGESEQCPFPSRSVDLSRPSVARVYDWYLGGSANWAIDREFGNKILSAFPGARNGAMANRLFLHRAVRHLAIIAVPHFQQPDADGVDIGPSAE